MKKFIEKGNLAIETQDLFEAIRREEWKKSEIRPKSQVNHQPHSDKKRTAGMER